VLGNSVLILNGKGGVLKTSLAAQLAGISAMSGWRTLAVDLDQQANLARDLGYTSRSDGGRSVLDAVVNGTALAPIADVRPSLDVVAGGPDMNRVYREVANADGNVIPTYAQLDAVLRPVAAHYDLVVIDSPPGGEAIHLAALTASRFVIIPTQPDQGSVDGLATVFRSLVSVRQSTNPSIEILGVVLGPVATAARRLRADTLARLGQQLAGRVHVFDHTIRQAQLVAVHCRDQGLLVHEYEQAARDALPWYRMSKEERRTARSFSQAAPGLADDYQQLTQEILARFRDRLEAAA
jgi:chromosome partitioning protein